MKLNKDICQWGSTSNQELKACVCVKHREVVPSVLSEYFERSLKLACFPKCHLTHFFINHPHSMQTIQIDSALMCKTFVNQTKHHLSSNYIHMNDIQVRKFVFCSKLSLRNFLQDQVPYKSFQKQQTHCLNMKTSVRQGDRMRCSDWVKSIQLYG